MIDIVESNYTADGHEDIIVRLLDDYASDIMGGGTGLTDDVKAHLVPELEKRRGIHTVLAFVDGEAAGLAICMEGFSTFACKPLLNIHDVIVRPEFRGQKLSRKILEKVEEIAVGLGCCKLTLEVLENNVIARNLYDSMGFRPYGLDPEMGSALFFEKKL